jgi:Major capsid protein Gp23
MSNVQSLLESANPWQSLQSDAARLAKKWGATGLLEGMGNETEKNNMSMILENQAKQLVIEQSNTGTGASFTTGTGEQWAGIALPLVRKVFGQIAAKEFVSVQPMNLPSGLVFFLDFQYGTTKNPFTSGNSMYGTPSENFGNTSTGALYGAGRFTYSTNQFSASVSSSAASYAVASASFAEVNFNSDYSASAVAGRIKKVSIPTASISSDLDPLAVRGFIATSGSTFGVSTLLQEFTTLSGNVINFFFTGSAGSSPVVDSTWLVEYNKLTKDNARGDFEAGAAYAVPNAESASEIVIPQINVQMRSEAIVAKTKKLKAQWTPEFAQDLNAYHSLDAEAELTAVMSEYISLEIDLEILDMLIESAAAGTEYWSAINNQAINAASTAFDQSLGFYNTQGQWFQTLGTKMQKLSNIIHQRTLRGGANFCVVSPTVATILESIPGFASTSNGDVTVASYAFGVQKMGQINNRYTIYKNPYMKENTILMGFKGSQFLETGAVFAPYIPLIMTPLVYDPDTFVPRKGLLTRYAKKMVRPEFYGKIYVSGLNTL